MALGWLPVIAVVAALFVAPASSGVAQRASLDVSPGGNTYGGQRLTFSGDLGTSGEQRIWLQRRGNAGAAWADVPNSLGKFMSNANGTFQFSFPAPAMNAVMFRVVSSNAATPSHTFDTVHQDAEISRIELNPAERPLPSGVSVATAVVGEPFTLRVDTAFLANNNRKKPVLLGREVILQRRTVNGGQVSWSKVGPSGALGNDGKVTFGTFEPGGLPQTPGAYRVRLESWQQGGDDIGWFLSFPFDLRVVDRPKSVNALQATAVDHTRVDLSWAVPADPRRDSIVITRSSFGQADLNDLVVATLPASATSYSDTSVWESTTYSYAVYTLSSDGVYVRVPARDDATTPPAPDPRGEGR